MSLKEKCDFDCFFTTLISISKKDRFERSYFERKELQFYSQLSKELGDVRPKTGLTPLTRCIPTVTLNSNSPK